MQKEIIQYPKAIYLNDDVSTYRQVKNEQEEADARLEGFRVFGEPAEPPKKRGRPRKEQ